MIDVETWLEAVRTRAGLGSLDAAERITHAVLGALGDSLDELSARALARELASQLAGPLVSGIASGRFDPKDFDERVARRVGEPTGFGREHARAVCTVLAETMSPEARRRIERSNPALAAELFALPEPAGREPPGLPPSPPERTTLASGRPGSTHPLSEAAPETAQTHSVVREDNPHAGTKLSSASGLRQEQDRETLATGRPGSRKPLSEH